MPKIDQCPPDLAAGIREFWPEEQWENAAAISELESGWNPFATNDTVTGQRPCGEVFAYRGGVGIAAERSVGYFQINTCNFPDWTWYHFFNVRHNCGTAHMLWNNRGWSPWYFSAKQLALL